MTQKRNYLILTGAAVAMFAACSHTGARRIPANDSPDMLKEQRTFTLINDKEIEKVVRVYKGTANSKVARIGINSPAAIVCQEGIPEADKPAAAQQPYMFEAKPDQDIFCYAPSDAPAGTPIGVDYFIPKATGTFEDVNVPNYKDVQARIKDVSTSNFDSDVQASLGALGLIEKTTITMNAANPSQLENAMHPTVQVVKGDLLQFSAAAGGIGTSKKQADNNSILPSGLTAPVGIKDKKTGAITYPVVVEKPVKPNKAMMFPDERPNRLICTIALEGAETAIVFRGGDSAVGMVDQTGTVECQINRAKKNPAKMAGSFTVDVSKISQAQSLERLTNMTTEAEKMLSAFKQHIDDEAIAGVRGEADELLKANLTNVKRFNEVTLRRNQEVEDARIAFEKEMKDTESFFPSDIALAYRRGPHTFSIRPEKKSVPTDRGMVDYVNYNIVGSETTWFPQDPSQNPVLKDKENPFTPTNKIESVDHFGSAGAGGIDFVVCPDKINDVNKSLRELASRATDPKRRAASRQDTWQALKDITERKGDDCTNWYDPLIGKAKFQAMSFKRVSRYQFCYSKGHMPNKFGGRDTLDGIAYYPSRIQAMYRSPIGPIIFRRVDSQINQQRGMGKGHQFFGHTKVVDSTWAEGEQYKSEICVEKNTLFPAFDTDGFIEGFAF